MRLSVLGQGMAGLSSWFVCSAALFALGSAGSWATFAQTLLQERLLGHPFINMVRVTVSLFTNVHKHTAFKPDNGNGHKWRRPCNCESCCACDVHAPALYEQ